MAERFYTVEPIDVEGSPFTQEGLQSTLDQIRATWGGKEHKPATVSPAMSLGSGAAVLGVENGRVLIIRDDAARDIARKRAATEQAPDGRVKQFYAKSTIARVIGPNKAELVDEREIEGEGLMGLFFQAAMHTQDILGDVPDCMGLEKCEQREASIRAQLSRAKSQERESTFINFPGSNTAPFFEVGTRPSEFYRVTLAVYTEKPVAKLEEAFPEIPRR